MSIRKLLAKWKEEQKRLKRISPLWVWYDQSIKELEQCLADCEAEVDEKIKRIENIKKDRVGTSHAFCVERLRSLEQAKKIIFGDKKTFDKQ
jgi:hypothetical protein